MSDKLMSRRKFLAGAGAVVGVAAVSGVGLANRPSTAEAAVTGVPWPYPLPPPTSRWPEKLARRAFEVYFASGCAEGVWWPFVEALAASHPETWGTLPQNVFRYGGGGVGGWGTLCGTLNGASAIIGMTVGNGTHRNNLIDAIMQYYAQHGLAKQRRLEVPLRGAGAARLLEPCHPPARERPHLDRAFTSLPFLARAVDHDDRRRERRAAPEGPLRQSLFRHREQDD